MRYHVTMTSRVTALVLAGLWATCLCACTCDAPLEGAVRVQLRAVNFRPGCFELQVSDAAATGVEPSSSKVAVTVPPFDRPYVFAVVKEPGWSSTLRVTALARERDCSGKVVARLEDSAVEVPRKALVRRSFELTAVDEDGDGWVRAEPDGGGGTDCDDRASAVQPGQPELCTNGLDDDCDGVTDCAQASCAGLPCDDGDPCTVDDFCTASVCHGQPRTCSTPSQACRQPAGACSKDAGCEYPLAAPGTPCDGGGLCRNDGVCVPSNSEVNCADGTDNDSDTLLDCADPDCASVPCDAGPCFLGAICSGAACGGGVAVTCPLPPQCRAAGVCVPASGACDYAALPAGGTCDDGDPCTNLDQCDAFGECVGAALSCNVAPTQCNASPGTCDAGVCLYTVRGGDTCDDGQACTTTDFCSAAAVCAGVSYTCTNPPACQKPAAAPCDGDGGCAYVPDPAQDGAGCDGGWGACNAGACVPPTGFTYSPANFVPTAVPVGGPVNVDCAVSFDSSSGAVSGNWCGGPAPAVYNITQSGSTESAVVLSMSSLVVATTGSLRLTGNRPVILAVFSAGVTALDGVIDARGVGTASGAGGNRPACGIQTGEDGGQNATVRASGGGGGAFATAGGAGGTADTGNVPGGVGGAALLSNLAPLVGGCPGGNGGFGLSNGGSGGAGGGALQISVAGELRVTSGAQISVSGGGGVGGALSQRCGGGGGGSGGGLRLEAMVLTVNGGARVTANGGAGGEGADADEAGKPGADGSSSDAIPAFGGTGGASVGGAGGNGGAGTTAPTPGPADATGGGGGGAVGMIVFRAAGPACVVNPGAVVSPPYAADAGCP